MSKKNDIKDELEAKGIEFDPKAKVAELEALAESVDIVSEDLAPVDSVEPEVSDEVPTEPVRSKFIEGKFVEHAPVMSATLVNGIMEVQTTVAHYRMSEEDYNNLK